MSPFEVNTLDSRRGTNFALSKVDVNSSLVEGLSAVPVIRPVELADRNENKVVMENDDTEDHIANGKIITPVKEKNNFTSRYELFICDYISVACACTASKTIPSNYSKI